LKYIILERLEIYISVHWCSCMVPKRTRILQTVSFNGTTFLVFGRSKTFKLCTGANPVSYSMDAVVLWRGKVVRVCNLPLII